MISRRIPLFMTSIGDVKLRAAIQFCLALGKTPTETYKMIQQAGTTRKCCRSLVLSGIDNLTLSVPDVISGRGDVGLITLVYVYFTQITLRVCRNITCVIAQILWVDRKLPKHVEIWNNEPFLLPP